jgi:hypothetical protein
MERQKEIIVNHFRKTSLLEHIHIKRSVANMILASYKASCLYSPRHPLPRLPTHRLRLPGTPPTFRHRPDPGHARFLAYATPPTINPSTHPKPYWSTAIMCTYPSAPQQPHLSRAFQPTKNPSRPFQDLSTPPHIVAKPSKISRPPRNSPESFTACTTRF